MLSSVAPGHIKLLRGRTRACDTKGYPKVKLSNVTYNIIFARVESFQGYYHINTLMVTFINNSVITIQYFLYYIYLKYYYKI